MYGSCLKALELTCSARVVIFDQIQTSKFAKCPARTRNHVESGQAPLHMHIQRSHCLHVLLGFLRSHTTLLPDVTHDHVSIKVHVTLRSKVAHNTSSCKVACDFPLTKAKVTFPLERPQGASSRVGI